MASDLRNYECFFLWEGDNAEFARYLGMKASTDGMFYLHIRKDLPFALIIRVNVDGYITERKPVYHAENIENIQYTFIDSLIPTTLKEEQTLVSVQSAFSKEIENKQEWGDAV